MEHKSTEIDAIRERLTVLNALNATIERRVIAGGVIAEDSFGDQLTFENSEACTDIIAERIISDFANTDSPPVLVSLMDGGFVFANMLQNALIKRDFLFHYTTMQVGSYNFSTSGTVEISTQPKIPLGERHVIIVDEISDTGKTFAAVQQYFLEVCGAKRVDLAVLVDKDPTLFKSTVGTLHRVQPFTLYSCFRVSPEAFLIGMGLDYNGGCRNLRDILVVNPATLASNEEKELLRQINILNERLQDLLKSEKQEVENVAEGKSPLLANSLLGSSSVTTKEKREPCSIAPNS